MSSFWELPIFIWYPLSWWLPGGKLSVSSHESLITKRHCTHTHAQCEREIADSESVRKSFISDLVLLFLQHIVWTSPLFWCTYMFVRGCVCVCTTCAYGCGCWCFACLLAMNANWARSSCLEQSARTSLLDPFSSSLHPSPPRMHTVSQEMT